jgi:hypothetical protein
VTQELLALAAGFGTNVGGYLLGLIVLNFGKSDTPSPVWLAALVLWLASMILGGWVASVVARSRQFLLGYLSAFLGMLAVVLVMRFVLHIPSPLWATVLGLLIVSALGALGALTYSRKQGNNGSQS